MQNRRNLVPMLLFQASHVPEGNKPRAGMAQAAAISAKAMRRNPNLLGHDGPPAEPKPRHSPQERRTQPGRG